MKTRIILLLSFVVLMLSSCSDDEAPKQKIETSIETPMSAYMKTVEVGSILEHSNGSTYSLGYQFKTKKAGGIIALGLAAPQAGIYRVSLYDAETDELLGTTEVTLTASQITAKPYGFQYSTLTTAVQAEEEQLFKVAYDLNTGTEKFYRPEAESEIFQLEGSFIEFQGGYYGTPGEAPDLPYGKKFYTVDIKFKYK